MVSQSKKYHAFISYSHKDKVYASAIQKSIETLILPFYKKWQPDLSRFETIKQNYLRCIS